MKNKLISLLTFVMLLIMAAPSYAQDGASTDDGGIPTTFIIIGVVAFVLALVIRSVSGIGSRRGTAYVDDFDDEDEIIVERPRRGGRKERRQKERGKRRGAPDIDDDPETYLIERDQVWEDDGYSGEEDVGF